MEKSSDIITIYRRILLVEKIKNVSHGLFGHRYWYDKKGVYDNYGDSLNPDRTKISPILIEYPGGVYKSFYPKSVTFYLYREKLENKCVCHVYEENIDNSDNNRYIYHSTNYYEFVTKNE